MLLSREAILGADDLPTKDVHVKQWGGSVRIRSLTGTDRDQFEADVLGARRLGQVSPGNVRARYVSLCVVDAEGNNIFSAADIEALGRKSGEALDTVYQAVLSLNALSDDDVEELAGNSEPAPNGASTSD
jgi:hypothetical protein